MESDIFLEIERIIKEFMEIIFFLQETFTKNDNQQIEME